MDWGDYNTAKANTRIPYYSTFVQLEDDKKDNKGPLKPIKKGIPQGKAPYGIAITKNKKGVASFGPALPAPPTFVRGEK